MQIVTMTTDFGLEDHYAGVMKGVVLERAPNARIVDISHCVPPGRVATAAYLLWAARRYFPPGTVHLAVVDPGVGSSRRLLAAEMEARFYVAPDNGLLTYVAGEYPGARFVTILPERLGIASVSNIFHGRDVMAPAAADLAEHRDLARLGDPAPDIFRLPVPPRESGNRYHRGHVLHIDHFGNLVTDIEADAFASLGPSANPSLEICGVRMSRFVSHYAEAPAGELCFLIGSNATLEVSINGGDAARRLGAHLFAAADLRY